MRVPTTPGSRPGAMPWNCPNASASSCATASRSNGSRCRRRRWCMSIRPPHACARKTSTSAWRRSRKVRRQPPIRRRSLQQPPRADPDPLMSIATRAQRAKSGSDGFIIVAVLWILAALATLVSIYAIFVTNSAIAVSASSDAIIADPLVSAGVELAAYQLIGVQADKRPTVGNFTARVGTARLVVAFQTEATRIDLNAAPKELLAGLVVGLGAAPLAAGGYADRIIAWRTEIAAQTTDIDPENSLY